MISEPFTLKMLLDDSVSFIGRRKKGRGPNT
jgi:hypothetical protein